MLHLPIQSRVREATHAVLPDACLDSIQVRPCPDPKFGDYQTTALMSLARERKMNPRQLAEKVLAHLQVEEWCEPPQIAGAGFINFRLKLKAIESTLAGAMDRKHLFFSPAAKPRTIVVDFSSPNVAKPMHVGHIRSTNLGDCLARAFRLLGHRVVTDNHIGDWGTQFGMLLVGWKTMLDRAAIQLDSIAEMERIYREVNAACEADEATAARARQELVKLQSGDAENLAIWHEMIALSQAQFDSIYSRLGTRFDHTLGESFYNPQLKPLVVELKEKGIARESEGAVVIFFEDDPALKENPALVQKSDGAANYLTTDLATVAYRLTTWNPDEIIYVTDGRQQLHFKQLFAAFAKWHPESKVRLHHVWFGAILGDDGRPFKTRTGGVVKLAGLLDEAEARAMTLVTEKNTELPEAQRREIARVVGIGSIKYSDLLPNRQSDYVFDWDKMLSLNGNTAPYLQYAYTRTRSIFRKAGVSAEALSTPIQLQAPEEITLAKALLSFGLSLDALAEEHRPNLLCNYLYDLAGHFARFYEACPVLKSSEPERSSRLALCELTGRVLKQGLEVLGIETTETM